MKLSASTPNGRRANLFEDCTSPVLVLDVISYARQADEAYQQFAEDGMHIVQSTDPITAWPGFLAHKIFVLKIEIMPSGA